MSAYEKTAGQRWPGALWITGEGRHAVTAHCGHGTTVTLHEDMPAAVEAKRWIDRFGCGGDCRNDHHIIDLEEA